MGFLIPLLESEILGLEYIHLFFKTVAQRTQVRIGFLFVTPNHNGLQAFGNERRTTASLYL